MGRNLWIMSRLSPVRDQRSHSYDRSSAKYDAAVENARRRGKYKGDILLSSCAIINTSDGYLELEIASCMECYMATSI